MRYTELQVTSNFSFLRGGSHPEELVEQAGLITFLAEGARADRLAEELKRHPGVVMATPFGQDLHVSGTDRAALEGAIAPYRREPYRWTETRPTLEEVFIYMMDADT